MCGARLACALLLHVSMLLMMYVGAALCTAARLAWDPSAYVALRALAPREYAAALAVLPAGAALLAAAALLAPAALTARRAPLRRFLLLLQAALLALLVALELALAGWLAARAAAFLRSEAAAQLAEALELLREHVRPLLHYLGRWHPLPDAVRDVIQEVEADLPRNGYAAAAAALLLLLLQLSGALLAVLAARAPPGEPGDPHSSSSSSGAGSGARSERAPLKDAYRTGRLELV